MDLTVRLFAGLRERAGTDAIRLDGLPDGLDVAGLKRELAARRPDLGPLEHVRGVVGTTYVRDDAVLPPGAEVALLPPVSGGAPSEDERLERGVLELRAEPLDLAEAHRRVAHPSCGAIVVFTGTTRERNRGRDVVRLDYEAFGAMAADEMERIFAECLARFGPEARPTEAPTPESAASEGAGPASTGPASAGPASAGPASIDPASIDPASIGTASTGTDSTGIDSTGADTTGTDSSDPANTDPASADPASADPVSADPVSADPASTGTASTGTASTGTASTGTASSGTASSEPELDDRLPEERRLRMLVLHRTGTVGVGEPSVAIAVASPHRDAAFRACRFLIDELKARVPLWKRELYRDGHHWIGERS